MNPSRINAREQGPEPRDESSRVRRGGRDPEFDRALAAANCGPQDPAAASAGAAKVGSSTGTGAPNACANNQTIPGLNGQSNGAVQIPELKGHPDQENGDGQERPAVRTRLESASTTTRDAEDRSAEQREIGRSDRESQELPAQIRRLWTEARLQSAGAESSRPEAEAGGSKTEPALPQSWANPVWNQVVPGRHLDTGANAGAPRSGPAPTQEQTDTLPGAGGNRSNHVTVHFAGEGGLDGRLRVAVRGQSVRATIVSEDHAMADRLSRNIDELHHALRGRGFSEASVSIQRGQQQTPDRSPHEAGSHRESEGREEGQMQRDRHQSDSENQRTRQGKGYLESER